MTDTDQLSIVPANEASCEDLQVVFGARGQAAPASASATSCDPGSPSARFRPGRAGPRLREQTDCGEPGAGTTSGLVAYLDGEPVGWCAVEPRNAYEGLLRVYRVPWEGRSEDKHDDSVWAVTCLFTRAGFRRQGISYALAKAAVELRAGAGCACAGGLPDDHPAGRGDRLGRAQHGQPQRVRSGRVHGSRQAHAQARRDADRLPVADAPIPDGRATSGGRPTGRDTGTAAPIILVPGYWLGAWAWDEVAGMLRADGHDVTAITLPGLESADADRSGIGFQDHVDAIVDAVEAKDAPVVLAVHSATGFTGYAASDRVPDRIAAMVYVDSAPGISPQDPDLEGDERPMNWDEIKEEENLDGLSEQQLQTFRERAVPVPAGVLRDTVPLTNDARKDIPSTIICTGFPVGRDQEGGQGAQLGVAGRRPRAAQRHLARPADQPLADVVAPGGPRGDHRGRREGARAACLMAGSLLDDAFAHHIWATGRLIDACADLSPDQLAASAPGTYGSVIATLRHLVSSDRWYVSFFPSATGSTRSTRRRTSGWTSFAQRWPATGSPGRSSWRAISIPTRTSWSSTTAGRCTRRWASDWRRSSITAPTTAARCARS